MMILSFAMILVALIICGLTIFLAVEIIVGLAPHDPSPDQQAFKQSGVIVIVPAHNEGRAILPTLADIQAQLGERDRLLVVADNCSDDTAAIARDAGAQCIERQDPERRGKGYALQYAIDHLRDQAPAIVIFVDADCLLGEGCLATLADAVLRTDGPVQATYLMQADTDAPPGRHVSEFAWMLINKVRMAGLDRIAGVTRLTGSGMAFPWKRLENAQFGGGHIVEDLAMTVTFTRNGAPPRLAADAIVTSVFPTTEDVAAKQRARWEHGSMDIARRSVTELFVSGIKKLRFSDIALALDLAMPPLILWMMVHVTGLAVTGLLLLAGVTIPFKIVAASLAVFLITVTIVWFVHGRSILPVRLIPEIMRYALGKRRVYSGAARASTATWTRTDRD